MARIRTIKPEFPQSESMGRVPREARLCFILLWTIADDEGRLRGDSRMLASVLYPYDKDAGRRIGGWLAALDREGCLIRYQIDGHSYIQICNWLNHQRIDHATKSKIPPPTCDSRILANPREPSSEDQGREGKGKEGKGEDLSLSADADRVFAHWQTVWNHSGAAFTETRRRLVCKALKDYTADQLCESIAGYRNSPHHCGQNERATVYDSIELFLRDAKHIDAGLRFAADPPRTDLSTTTRRNVAAVQDWTPPEMRKNAN